MGRGKEEEGRERMKKGEGRGRREVIGWGGEREGKEGWREDTTPRNNLRYLNSAWFHVRRLFTQQ